METEQYGPFTMWMPSLYQQFWRWWFKPYYNRRRRFWLVWGWLFWVLLFVAMFYFTIVPAYVFAGMLISQVLTLVAQGVAWLVWGSWHRPEKLASS